MASADDRRDALLSQVATRYYVGRETQEEIAQGIGRSVATVSRLLSKAEAAGVVEMDVRQPHALVPALQSALINRFGLRVARVVHVSPAETHTSAPRIGDLAARFLATILEPDSTLTVGWGSHIQAVALALPAMTLRDAHVVQGLGSRGTTMPQLVHPRLVQSVAMRLEATPHFLPAPMITATVAERDALDRDPYFGKVFERIGRTDVALLGIGPTNVHYSALYRTGFLDEWDLERVRSRGAVGELLAEFFDIQGRLVKTDMGPRIVGMREADMRRAGAVLAVAGGEGKAAAILGALRSGLVDILVTDSIATRAVLALADQHSAPTFAVTHADRRLSWNQKAAETECERQAILRATLRELDRVGYQKLSPTAIAQESHVSAGHIYRNWNSRVSLVRDAWRLRQSRYGCGGGDSLRDDLVHFLDGIPEQEGTGNEPYVAARTMAAEAQLDPEFRRVFNGLERAAAEYVQQALQRALARGEMPEDARLDMLADMVLGAIWYRLLFGKRPLDAAFATELSEMVLRAARADRSPASVPDGMD